MSELKPLHDLVARSQKIGADQSMVVYGGGNTSSKGEIKDFDGQAIAKLAFFAFFLVTEDMIAARGRGGGLALWIREN